MVSNTSLLLICHSGSPHITQVRAFLKTNNAFVEFVAKDVHPDLHVMNPDDDPENFSPLQIEEARHMTQEMLMKPYQSDQSLYVICKIDAASVPAQNALLKALEEPPTHVQFLLTTDQLQRVLPTIQSRCLIIKIGDQSVQKPSSQTHEDLQKISQGTINDIFDISEKYKDRAAALQFVNECIQFIHQENVQQPTKERTHQLQKLLITKELLQKNVNVRLVMEECFFNFITL